jgi:hypothetical protein
MQHNHGMNLHQLSQLGFLVADQTAGPFALEVATIDAFRYSMREMQRDSRVQKALQANEELGYTSY